MTSARTEFHRLMAQRRTAHPSDRVWLSHAARNLVWIIRGIPANEWNAQ